MWKRLIDMPDLVLQRGFLLKFPAQYPFEGSVVMMVSGYPDEGNRLGSASLMTITGYNAGVNPYVLFPPEVREFGALNARWLIDNWNKWVWPEGNVNDVLVRESLTAAEL